MEKLADCTEFYSLEGVLIKFKTIDTAGDEYKYALGVRIDNRKSHLSGLMAGLGVMGDARYREMPALKEEIHGIARLVGEKFHSHSRSRRYG